MENNFTDTSKMPGEQLNVTFEEQRDCMRAVRLSPMAPRAENYIERIRITQEKAAEQEAIASGQALPYPTATLEEAARWIGCNSQSLKNLVHTLPVLQGAVRNVPDGNIEFYSGALHAHKAYIEKVLGIRRVHRGYGQKAKSIYPSRDEIIKMAGIRINGAA
jgi:hypothetical protein